MRKLILFDPKGNRSLCCDVEGEGLMILTLGSGAYWDLHEQMSDTNRRQDVVENVMKDIDFEELFRKWNLSQEDINEIEQDILDRYTELERHSDSWFNNLSKATAEVLQPYREQYDNDLSAWRNR